ncbi:hypothetical protein IFM89_015479 [Coptis chinensis]|uniref:Uncharacterized protein n=1 Tax=Coptis chinensis TaxID=261450 RepID=A0A835GZ19_9MAGN|nr:hypothetical protein IFM89_015479 [Coptis chinensis]
MRINKANVGKIGENIGTMGKRIISCPSSLANPLEGRRGGNGYKGKTPKGFNDKAGNSCRIRAQHRYELSRLGGSPKDNKPFFSSQIKANKFFNGIAYTGKQTITIAGVPNKLRYEETPVPPAQGGKGYHIRARQERWRQNLVRESDGSRSKGRESEEDNRSEHQVTATPTAINRVARFQTYVETDYGDPARNYGYGPKQGYKARDGLDRESGCNLDSEKLLRKTRDPVVEVSPTELDQDRDQYMGQREEIGSPQNTWLASWTDRQEKDLAGAQMNREDPCKGLITRSEENRIIGSTNLILVGSKANVSSLEKIQTDNAALPNIPNQSTGFQFQSKAMHGRRFKTMVSRGPKKKEKGSYHDNIKGSGTEAEPSSNDSESSENVSEEDEETEESEDWEADIEIDDEHPEQDVINTAAQDMVDLEYESEVSDGQPVPFAMDDSTVVKLIKYEGSNGKDPGETSKENGQEESSEQVQKDEVKNGEDNSGVHTNSSS